MLLPVYVVGVFWGLVALSDALRFRGERVEGSPKINMNKYQLTTEDLVKSLEHLTASTVLNRKTGFKDVSVKWAAYQVDLEARLAAFPTLAMTDKVTDLAMALRELSLLSVTLRHTSKKFETTSYIYRKLGQISRVLDQSRHSFVDLLVDTHRSIPLPTPDLIAGLDVSIPARFFDPTGPYLTANSVVLQEMMVASLGCLFVYGNRTCTGKPLNLLEVPEGFISQVQEHYEATQALYSSVKAWHNQLQKVAKTPEHDPDNYYRRAIPFVAEMLARLKLIRARLDKTLTPRNDDRVHK